MSDGKRDAPGVTADVSDDVIQAALESVEGGPSRIGSKASNSDGVGTIELDLPEPASGSISADSVEDSQLEKELSEVRAQLDLSVERARETLDRLKDTHERYLRAAADLENYKKRAIRERDEAERFGVQKLLKDLLPVLDNLERALAHAETTNPLTEGVQATRRIFEDTVGRYGVKGFSALGQPFDPNKHEAMQQVETKDCAPGTVVLEMVRGYTLHDRLIRPALVAVAVAPVEAASNAAVATSAAVAPVAAPLDAPVDTPADTEGSPQSPAGAGKVP